MLSVVLEECKGISPNFNTGGKASQPVLFDFKQSRDLTLVPVPDRVAFDLDRYYVCCGDWIAGVQLTREQAYRAIELCGRSRDPDVIWWAIECAIEGGIR